MRNNIIVIALATLVLLSSNAVVADHLGSDGSPTERTASISNDPGPRSSQLIGPLAESHGDFGYGVINGGAEIEILGYDGPEGDVVIPDTIEGKPVTAIGNNVFYDGYGITSVIIPNSVKSIGDHTFSFCSDLSSVTIGSSVTSIGQYAFAYCGSLTSVVVPDSVISIGAGAFHSCTSMTSITLSKNLITIGGEAFENSALASIVIPDSVTSIGGEAFAYCSDLTSVTISANINSIERWTFARCIALASIIIPDGVTSIGFLAFNGCTALSFVNLGEGVKTIGNSAFLGCTSLHSIIIPDSLTTISTNSFRGCSALVSVAIPDTVTRIDTYAFAECASLTAINVEGTNPNYASVEGVLYNKGLTTLMQYPGGKGSAFTVPSSVARIDNLAFGYTTALTSVTVGSQVTLIIDSAFRYSSSLTSINIDEDNPKYASLNGVFYNKDLTELLQYPGGRSGAFTVPGTVTFIGGSAFEACSALTSVTLGDSVTTIGSYAFYRCSSLSSIVVPDNVINMGDAVFSDCTALASVDLGKGLHGIGFNVFNGCTALTSITIPDNIGTISPGAFQSCTSMTSVVMGTGVSYIGDSAFDGCTALTTIIFNGNAPSVNDYWNRAGPQLTIFFREGAIGFSTPVWEGKPCLPLGATPTAPNGLRAEQSNGVVTLSWSAPTYLGDSAIDHYVVRQSVGVAYFESVELRNVTEMSCALTGLMDDVYYSFSVVAHNSAGDGRWSNTVIMVFDNIPTIVDKTPIGSDVPPSSIVKVTFSEAMNRSSVSIAVNDVEGTTSWNGNTMTFRPSSSLQGGTDFTVNVRGKDHTGHELESTTWTFTTANSGTVSGIVVDKNGSPVAGANVTLTCASNSSNNVRITTDAEGRYCFYDVLVGEYTLEVEKDGFSTTSSKVKMTSAEVAEGGISMGDTVIASAPRNDDAMLIIVVVVAVAATALMAMMLVIRKGKGDKK